MKKSPCFQLYPNEWLASTRIALMTPAQEGAYIRLLCIAWNDPECAIPDNDQELAVLTRMGADWVNGSAAKVRACFEPHPTIPGKLHNARLMLEREKQREWREKSSSGGKKSAESRTKGIKGGSVVVDDRLQPKGNIAVSSLQLSFSEKEQNHTPADAGDVPGEAGDPETRRGIPPCPHAKIIALYHDLCPTLDRVKTWKGERPTYSRGRWRETCERLNLTTEEQGLAWFRSLFEAVAESDWLTGKVQPRGTDSTPFMADLEWLLRPKNFAKVIEGKYWNRS